MPRYGNLDLKAWAARAPLIDGFGTEPWTLKGAQILEFRHEIEDVAGDALVPPALHPAIPAYATFSIIQVPESPAGPFNFGEVRIAGRSGGRPVGFVLRCFCDNEAARRELAARWGYPAAPGKVELVPHHYRVSGRVIAEGRTVLEITMLDRRPLAGANLQSIASINLARNQADEKIVLVHVETQAAFASSETGKQHFVRLDPEAFGADDRLHLTSPMGAGFAVADLTLPRIQFITDPARPAEEATTFLPG